MDLFLKIAEAFAEFVKAHLAKDDEARHQAIIKLNRISSDEIARKELGIEGPPSEPTRP